MAIIITYKDLNELGRGSWVVNGFSAEELNGLQDFHLRTFGDAQPGGLFSPLPNSPGNGLFSDVVASKTNKDQGTKEIMKLLQNHCMEKSRPIAGNSIHCDREVMMLEMPEVYHFFNHRIIDVSSFIGVMDRWLPQSHEAFGADHKKNADYNHCAVNDVELSIQAMRWIRQHLLVPDSQAGRRKRKEIRVLKNLQIHRLADADGHAPPCLTMTIRGILHII